MSCLNAAFQSEQEDYSMNTSSWVQFESNQLISDPVSVATFDLAVCTLDEIKTVSSEFELTVSETARIGGFVGWFDVDFHGSCTNPVENNITLSTSPYVTATHWGQQLFPLIPGVQCLKGNSISGNMAVTRRNENQRLMNVKMEYGITTKEEEETSKVTKVFKVE